MGFKEDVSIDFLNLEFDLQKQPGLYMEWAERKVNKDFERDRKKQQIDLLRSDLDAKIRSEWEEYGFEKAPTEPGIKAWIEKHENIIELKDEFLELSRESGVLAASLIALEHRKRSLQGIVSLAVNNILNLKTGIPTEVKEELGAKERRKQHQKTINQGNSAAKLKRRNKV